MKKVTLQVNLEVPEEWTDREVESHFQEWLWDLESHYRERLRERLMDTNDAFREAAIRMYNKDIAEVKAAVLSVHV